MRLTRGKKSNVWTGKAKSKSYIPQFGWLKYFEDQLVEAEKKKKKLRQWREIYQKDDGVIDDQFIEKGRWRKSENNTGKLVCICTNIWLGFFFNKSLNKLEYMIDKLITVCDVPLQLTLVLEESSVKNLTLRPKRNPKITNQWVWCCSWVKWWKPKQRT